MADKKLDFKDFLTVDYAPGMDPLIKRNAKKRKGGDTETSGPAESVVHEAASNPPPMDMVGYLSKGMKYNPKTKKMEPATQKEAAVPPGGNPLPALTPKQAHKWLDQGKHSKRLSGKDQMGWPTKDITVKQEPDNKGKQHHVHVHQYMESTEDTLDEALNISQRRQRAIQMRRREAKIELGRERSLHRFANLPRLKNRARKEARAFIFKRISKDIPKDELTYARRQEIEKRMDSPAMKKRIEILAMKLLKKVRAAEIQRHQSKNPNANNQ